MSSIRPTPVLLLSTERSGTNLLRSILSSHSNIASAPAAGIVPNLLPYCYRYLVGNETDIKALVEDGLSLIEAHPGDWEMKFKVNEVLEKMSSPSYWEFFRVVNELYAGKQNKEFWLCKEPNIFDWAHGFKLSLPNAKFIYMARDGRDVASSMLKGGLHECHIYGAARRWKLDQQKCLQLLADPCFVRDTFFLRYEDLLMHTEETVKQLADFLSISFEKGMLEYFERVDTRIHSQNSTLWKNLSKPLMKNNYDKFRENLSRHQIRIFESIAHEELISLGYQLTGYQKNLRGLEQAFYSALNAACKQKKMIGGTSPERSKRKKWFEVTHKIANRDIRRAHLN